MSPAKKKKNRPRRSGRRTAPTPKGMYLRVDMHDNDELHEELIIRGFQDIVSVGHTVARAVREFIRGVPMTRNPRSYTFMVYPEWVGEAKLPRSAREADAGGVGEPVSDLD